MEANAPITRKRRKPVHSTKCPCCSDDRGKPEKEPRRRRREDVDLEPSNTTAGDDRSTSTKRTQVIITNSKVIETVNQSSSEVDDEEICEGRVLRSGQSTPVPSEIEKEKTNGQSKKANSKKVAKKSVLATRKGSRKSKKSPGNSDVEKKKGKRSLAQDSDNFKPISKNTDYSDRKSAQATRAKKKSSQATQGSDQVEKISKKGEEKPTRQSIKKPSVRKHVKLPPVHRKSLVTKTLAIDKLKIRAFDNLKEKLEIAFEQNSLTVPECVELFQKITSENLKAILESDEGPAMMGRACEEIESGDDLTEEVTDSGSEARAMEKKLAENMNESEAAKALVSFKVQTTAVNSTFIQSRTNSTSQELQNSKELMNSLPSQGNAISSTNNPLKSLDNLTATAFAGLTGLPLNKPLRATEVQASAPSVILQTAPVPSIPIVQAPMTFQLLQVPSQATKGNHPGDLQGTPLQQTPGFIYQNPTTMINQLTSVNQQATGLFPPTLNQLLYLTKLNQQHDGKSVLNPNFCGFLPGMQGQDQALYSSASGSVTCTNLANTTISTLGPTSTNNNEIQSSTKLRPILPREPLVTPSFPSFASQGLTLGTSSSILSKVTTPSSNTVHVKQEIKRMVSERTKANDVLTPEVTTSLPDIASTFAKSSVRPMSSLESYQSEATSGPKQSMQQEATEMTSKEQAIKALLSIGGNGSLSHGNGEPNGSSNRSYETNETNGLKVVFESDKGIFKVDDVTIDPLINTISKESYTCGKCSKIFTSLSYLARHIKRVCPDMSHRKWKCNHCDKAFRHPFGLQQHIYTHTGERPHKCPQCPKAFYSSNDLRRHSRIHSGERPYKCKHCGKNFATTISLKTHTFIHTGEKPHRCPHCTKTFATSSKLGRHIVTHSEQRPYSCNQCPKTFNRSGDLRRHTLHVHDSKITDNPNTDQQEEKIYRCTECSGAFDTAKELEAHINEHTTEITQKMFVPHDLS